MNVSFEKIEYLPFNLEFECHYKKTYTVNVIKFINLKIDNGGELIEVKEKCYPFLIGLYNQFHSIPDLCGQFEVLNSFDKEIIPFFISESDRSVLSSMEFSIQEFIPYVYSTFYKINQSVPINIFESSIIFKEAYMIVDFHKMIPKSAYINSNSQLPEWYQYGEEHKWAPNTGCLKIHPLVQKENIGVNEYQQTNIISEYSDGYDYFIRYGIDKFKEKVLSTLDRKEIKSKGVYISRVNTTKVYESRYGPDLFRDRCYTKEDFFENYFKNIGYEVIYLENLIYKKQLEVLLNTKNIVALHGSGLVNTFVCDEDTNIYEIMLPVAKNNWWQNFFFFFSPISGCIDKKNVSTSCTKNRRWKQIYNEEYAINVEKWLTD